MEIVERLQATWTVNLISMHRARLCFMISFVMCVMYMDLDKGCFLHRAALCSTYIVWRNRNRFTCFLTPILKGVAWLSMVLW